MKIFIFIAVLFSSVNSFAGNFARYCLNTPTVAYISVDLDPTVSQRLSLNTVSFGRLIANLNDGTSVIAPCDSYTLNNSIVSAVVVNQSKVFTVVHVDPTKNGKTTTQIIGVNLKTSTLLTQETTLKVLKTYYIQHSDDLERIKK
jgi:hypothetical protein